MVVVTILNAMGGAGDDKRVGCVLHVCYYSEWNQWGQVALSLLVVQITAHLDDPCV